MIALTRRPAFWVGYVVLALASLVVAWQLVPQAIPLLQLDIRMSRGEALAQAEALAAQHRLAPEGARSAIVFNHDENAQNYIELEGGGREAFARLMEGDAFAPYWWDVRLFRSGVIDEVLIRFRPDGRISGFTRKVAETYVRDPATMALDPEQALLLARVVAAKDWGVDFAAWQLLEKSQQTRTTGRVDHQFVFERGERLGEARIRLQLVVDGDELIQVQPYMHVPESFMRRFAELRSANSTIAGMAGIGAGLLYGLGGCVLGSLWLLRRHWLLWKPALAAGLVVGGLLAGASLAAAPTAWFSFSTAQQENIFWWRQGGLALLALAGGGVALGGIFMAAEGLTRRAFPTHPQLWRLWSRDAAGTGAIAGRTAAGYLFVPIELALVAAFYFVTNQWLGWWQPSESLTDPNVLASTIPALAPIAISLQAGFMEECLFRAVPLALGALLGAHFGRRRTGIAIAFVLQAVVFGAAHANYPGLPAYSRLVELIVPSLIWAGIFLRFGLLPTILLHALFDLVLFSLPLFLIDAPGAGTQRALVIAAALIPAAVVLTRRMQAGGWGRLSDALRNGAWEPVVPAPAAPEAAPAVAAGNGFAHVVQRALPVLGVAGLALWLGATSWRADVPSLPIGRAEAESIAAAAMREHGGNPDAGWHVYSVVRLAPEDGGQRVWHAFVWREAGPETYRRLAGSFLAPPLWEVRFARFEGDVAERAEEWRVTVAGDGQVRLVFHRLPEARAGATLERDVAARLAREAIDQAFGVRAAPLPERLAEATARPARRDWAFLFADPAVEVGGGGEVRYQVVIVGDEVVSIGRSVFVPESWRRAELEREGFTQILRIGGLVVIVLMVIAALIFAVRAWSAGRFDRRVLLAVGAFTVAIMFAQRINHWPALAIALKTTEPVLGQLATVIVGLIAGGALLALVGGILAGVGAWYARRQTRVPLLGHLPGWLAGIAAALATAGVTAAADLLVPQTMPLWPELKAASAAWPWAGALAAGLSLVPATAVTFFLLAAIDRGTAGWTRRIGLAAVFLVLAAGAMRLAAGQPPIDAAGLGIAEGLLALLFAWAVLRYDLSSVPAFVATGLLLEVLRTAVLGATPASWQHAALEAPVIAVVAWYLTRLVLNGRPDGIAEAAAPASAPEKRPKARRR